MSVIDILTRVDAICKKYDKYDVEKKRDSNVSGDDAFSHLYSSVESDIETAYQKAKIIANESNRVSIVALNVEIRRIIGRLLEEVSKLQRLTQKRLKSSLLVKSNGIACCPADDVGQQDYGYGSKDGILKQRTHSLARQREEMQQISLLLSS